MLVSVAAAPAAFRHGQAQSAATPVAALDGVDVRRPVPEVIGIYAGPVGPDGRLRSHR